MRESSIVLVHVSNHWTACEWSSSALKRALWRINLSNMYAKNMLPLFFLFFFFGHPLQQKTKTRKFEQCVIYLVLLSGDRRPVVVPRKSFYPALWIIFFFCSKTPCASLTFLKVHLKFHLGSGAAQEQKKWKTFIFSAFHWEGRRKWCRVRERCLSQWVSARVCDCNRVGRWLCVCVSAYWEGRQNAAI